MSFRPTRSGARSTKRSARRNLYLIAPLWKNHLRLFAAPFLRGAGIASAASAISRNRVRCGGPTNRAPKKDLHGKDFLGRGGATERRCPCRLREGLKAEFAPTRERGRSKRPAYSFRRARPPLPEAPHSPAKNFLPFPEKNLSPTLYFAAKLRYNRGVTASGSPYK